jgi:hypothetical protein
MKYLVFSICLQVSLYAVTAEELMEIHKVTTVEMESINSPVAGSLVYNTIESTLFFYTGNTWKKLRSSGSETVVTVGSGITLMGEGTTSSPYSIGL